MTKRPARPVAPDPTHEEARQMAANVTSLEEVEAALAGFRDHVRLRWYEIRTPEKAQGLQLDYSRARWRSSFSDHAFCRGYAVSFDAPSNMEATCCASGS